VKRRVILVVAVLAAATAQYPPAAPAAAPGVQAHLLWSNSSSAAVERELDRLASIGARYVRVDVGWSTLESKGRGQISTWYLDRLDHLVSAANRRGLELILTFWETPCWASSAPDSIKQNCAGSWWERGVQRYAPRDPADYARALAMVVERYGNRVAAWEVWNEPNHPDFLKGGDQVSQYAELLRAAYPAAKSANPGPRILGGSLANSDFAFTDALLDRGVRHHYDAWSIHPYSEDRSPLDPGPDAYVKNSFIRGIPAVRRTLIEHGAAAPLWLTEFGWSTCNVRGTPQAYRNCVSEGTQADYLQQAYRQMRQWDYVSVGVWFNAQDTTSDPSDKSRNFGLRRFDGSPKPAFYAFRNSAIRPGPRATDGSDAVRKLTLEASSVASGIRARGESRADAVLVRLYRYLRKAGRFAKEPAYRARVSTDAAQRYRSLAPAAHLRRGRWRVEASTTVGGEPVRRRDEVRWPP
jgi:hypothetical protein